MRRLILLAVIGLGATAAPARAELNLVLENVRFADGTAVTGVFSLNVYGYLSAPIDMSIQASGSFPGGHLGDNSSFNSNLLSYTYSIGTPATSIYDTITLALQSAPGTVNVDPIVTGGSSYECIGTSTYCQTLRYIVSGDVRIPEPASIALLATGMAGAAAVRRQTRTRR